MNEDKELIALVGRLREHICSKGGRLIAVVLDDREGKAYIRGVSRWRDDAWVNRTTVYGVQVRFEEEKK